MGLCLTWWPPPEYRWRPRLKMTRRESSIIPFLVPHCKVWLTPTARLPCSNAARTQDLDAKWILHLSEFRQGARAPKMYIKCTSPGDAKHCAKFGWPLLSDVAALTKPRRKTRWNLLGCPKLANRSQTLVGRRSPYCDDIWRTYWCLTSFFRLTIHAIVAQILSDKFFGVIFVCCIFSEPQKNISDMHSKFALRPYHARKYDRHPISNRWEYRLGKNKEERRRIKNHSCWI